MHQCGCISIKTNWIKTFTIILTSVSPQVRASRITKPQAVVLNNHQPSSPSPFWFTWNVYPAYPRPLPLHSGFAVSLLSLQAPRQMHSVPFLSHLLQELR